MMIRMQNHELQFPPEMFSLLDYPFILNSGTKAQIFRYEVTHNVPHIGKLTVSRMHIVDDTMSYLTSHSENWMADDQKALLRIPLKVVFDGEEGIDAGGLSNEFFQLILAQLFDKKYNMFTYHENERLYWFQKFPCLDEGELEQYYCFVGVIFGLAMANGVNIENHFPHLFYKQLLGKGVDFDDLK